MNNKIPASNQFLADLVTYVKYSSFLPDEHRKQTWNECVDVLMQMHIEKYPKLTDEIVKNTEYIRNKLVMPSMRSIQFGGKPIKFAPNRMYNCSFVAIDNPFVFAEIAMMLLSGNGVGYSVQKRHVNQLPEIKKPEGFRRYLIADSIEGWSDSFRALIYAYMKGKPMPNFDYDDIRAKGSLIKKTGSLAPGYQSLLEAHFKVKAVFDQAIGRKLESIEVHDIICYIAECIVAGGVRTSALIALFDKTDMKMLLCKSSIRIKNSHLVDENDKYWIVKFKMDKNQQCSTNCYDGEHEQILRLKKSDGDYDKDMILNKGVVNWYLLHPQRMMANNSIVFHRSNTSRNEFDDIFDMIKESNSGEPGVFWTNNYEYGGNPCNEIALISAQFCNLTTINTYSIKSQNELNEYARVASFFGTLQAGYTDFHYLRPIWRENTEKEALLGVSMTGIASGNVLAYDLKDAARNVVSENIRIAKMIGINTSKRLTCIKPEGSSTLSCGILGSGIHAIHSQYIIRNFRIKKHDPIYHYLLGVMPDFIADEWTNKDTAVISIPISAPEGSILRTESALSLLERIKRFSTDWIVEGHVEGDNKHNVSATISVKEDEWEDVRNWMWENRNFYNGLTVLPYDNGIYRQAPYEEIDKQKYEEMISAFPTQYDLKNISYEYNMHNRIQDPACAGGSCEVKSL